MNEVTLGLKPAERQIVDAAPSFPREGRRAVTFIFEVECLKRGMTGRDADDIRLARLVERLQAENSEAYGKLISPLASYFDDILNVSGYHVNRPLVMAAEAAGQRQHMVEVHFPQALHYEAENRAMAIHLTPAQTVMTLAFHDAVAVFRSGHVFYLLTVSGEGASALDEYQLIALQKLFSTSEHTAHLRREIRFAFPGEHADPLDVFINRRLRELGHSRVHDTNAVRDVLLPYLYHAGPEEKAILQAGWRELKGMFIALESQKLLDFSTGPYSFERHDALLALAGFAQGVLDFPEQDEAEILDSLDPIASGETYVAFNKPGVLVEVGGEPWRSLHKGAECLGTCPYFAMTALCLAYNETIVTEVEEALDDLIYGMKKAKVHAAPLASLSEVVRNISKRRVSQTRLLKRNLEERIGIFRNGVLCRVPNLFRYETEREVFEAAEKARSVDLRFNSVVSVLDRYEQILEDIHYLGNYVAERRMNRILLVIALLGVLALVKDAAAIAAALAAGGDWLLGLLGL